MTTQRITLSLLLLSAAAHNNVTAMNLNTTSTTNNSTPHQEETRAPFLMWERSPKYRPEPMRSLIYKPTIYEQIRNRYYPKIKAIECYKPILLIEWKKQIHKNLPRFTQRSTPLPNSFAIKSQDICPIILDISSPLPPYFQERDSTITYRYPHLSNPDAHRYEHNPTLFEQEFKHVLALNLAERKNRGHSEDMLKNYEKNSLITMQETKQKIMLHIEHSQQVLPQ